MALSPILGIQQVSPNQSSKETTINDAILALEAAGNGTLVLDYTGVPAAYTLDETHFSRAFLFKAINRSTPAALHLPRTLNGNPINRIFVVKNATTNTLTVTIDGAATGTTGALGIVLPEGSARLIAMEGDDIFVASEATTVSRFIDLADVPGSYAGKAGLTYRVNATETGLEFGEGLTLSGLYDVDVDPLSDGDILKYNTAESKWVATPLSVINTFLGLGDAPHSYAGMAGYLLHVNAASNALEFVNPASLGGPVTGGGNTGQVLTKNSATDGDYGWHDAPVALPSGGTAGQYLRKNSSTDGDAVWVDLPATTTGLPSGGTAGQVLAKHSNADGDAEWVDAASASGTTYAPCVVHAAAHGGMNHGNFNLPWTPTPGNALIAFYFSNVGIAAASGWTELAALPASGPWGNCRTFGRIVAAGDSNIINCCNTGTADAIVVYEIDMRYLSGGLASFAPTMAYNNSAIPTITTAATDIIIAATANRGGAIPTYTVTGSTYNTIASSQDGAATDRFAGGVYIETAPSGETIDISYTLGTGGASGVYAYLVIPAIPSPLEEAPTDGFSYVRSLKKWIKQPASLPVGGATGQILAKVSNTNQDATWINPPAGVPTGGAAGQILLKNSGTAGDYGWATKGFVPSGGSGGYALVKNSGSDYDLKWIALPTAVPAGGANGNFLSIVAGVPAWVGQPHDLPTGGGVGQYLVKSGTGDYAVSWATGPSGVPAGGTTGQILAKRSNADGDLLWEDAPQSVPAGGLTGQILTKASNTDYVLTWSAAPISLPAGGSAGQVLTKNSGTDGDASWSAPGVSDAPTDGQLYARINGGWQMFAPTGGTGGGTGGATIVRPHRFWRINIASNNGATSTSVAELVLRTAAAGPDMAVGGTPIGTMAPQGNAFDQIAGTASSIAGTSGIIGYDFGASNVKGILEIQVWAPSDPTKAPQSFAVQYSDDGGAWSTAWSVTGQTGWAAGEQRTFTNPSPDYITATYVLEAPTDGVSYVRKNGAWTKQGTPVANGGTTGQILAKNSNTDGDILWVAPPQGIPVGGTAGQVLGKASNVDGDVAWRTVVAKLTDLSDVPNSYATSGGLLLAINSTGTGVTFVSPTSTQIVPSYGTHAYWRVRVSTNGGASFAGIAELGFKASVYGANLATGGAAAASGYGGTSAPSLAFDGSAASEWQSPTGSVNGAWLGYHFAAPASVRAVVITGSQTPSATPLQFAVEYSDDGAAWTTAWSVVETAAWTAGASRTYRSPSTLNITDLADAPASLTGQAGKVLSVNSTETGYQLTAAPVSLPTGGTTGQVLTKNSATNGDASWTTFQTLPTGGTAGQVLTKHSSTNGDAIWSTPAVAGTGPGAFGFWRVLITSGHGTVSIGELEFRPEYGGANQTTGGTASASSFSSSTFSAPKAFDGSPTTWWQAGGSTYPQWIAYAFASPVEVREIAITSRSDASYQQAPLSGVVQYSSDGITWLQGFSFTTTDDWAMSETRAFSANYGLSTHDLLDIDYTTAPTDGQALVWNASTEKLAFATVGSGSGGTIPETSASFHVTAVGTGVPQVVVLPRTVTVDQVMVFVNGLRYAQSELSITGADLTLTTNEAGASIEIIGLPTIVSVSGGSSTPWDFRPPLASDFVHVDDGVHLNLIDDADVGLRAYGGVARTGDVVRSAIQSAPSGDFTVIAKMIFTGQTYNYGGAGICVYDAVAANRIVCFGSDLNGGITLRYFASPAGYISVPAGASYPTSTSFGWFKITRTGSNLNFYFSNDGKSWNAIALGVSQTDNLINGVTHFGFYVWYNRGPTMPSNDITVTIPYLYKSW